MKIVVRLNNPQENITHTGAERTYIDGIFFCVIDGNSLYKYRIDNVWLIIESPDEDKKEV